MVCQIDCICPSSRVPAIIDYNEITIMVPPSQLLPNSSGSKGWLRSEIGVMKNENVWRDAYQRGIVKVSEQVEVLPFRAR